MINVFPLRATLAKIYAKSAVWTIREIMLYLAGEGMQRRGTAETLSSLAVNIASIVRKNSYQVFMDNGGRIVGYCMWESACPVEPGASTVRITYFFSAKHALRPILWYLSNVEFREYDSVIYSRQIRRRLVTKMISRLDYCYLFRSGDSYIAPESRDSFDFTTPGAATAVRGFLGYAQKIGEALFGLALDARYDNVAISALVYRLDYLISMRQVKIFRNRLQDVSGIVTWARLSSYTVGKLRYGSLAASHPSEWNEGTALCLWDLVLPGDMENKARRVLQDLIQSDGNSSDKIYVVTDSSAGSVAEFNPSCITDYLHDLPTSRQNALGMTEQSPV